MENTDRLFPSCLNIDKAFQHYRVIMPVIHTKIKDFPSHSNIFSLDMVMALVDAANDKDKSVTEMVRSSLYAIGLEKPELVLSLCKDYILKHQKVQNMLIVLHLVYSWFVQHLKV
jgi:hypothetical protein